MEYFRWLSLGHKNWNLLLPIKVSADLNPSFLVTSSQLYVVNQIR